MKNERSKVAVITARGRRTLTEEQADRLEACADVTYKEALDALSADEIVYALGEADYAGLTPRSVREIEDGWLERLPDLKGISVFATGVDYIDTEALKRRGMQLSHLPDYSTESVAEHAIGLILTMSRRIHLSQDRVRGRVPESTSVMGWEMRGRTIGICGLGRIGSRVAEPAQAFGMRVLGYDPKRSAVGVKSVGMEELLVSSDVVSLHFPAVWQGDAVFGARELAKMKPGATLINVSRCALVDSMAVVEAIERRTLRGYAVDDIFPIGESDDRAVRQIAEGRLLQTGHTAWYSEEVIARGYDTWVDNLIGMATGNPQNLVRL